jgi:hypothetical protein
MSKSLITRPGQERFLKDLLAGFPCSLALKWYIAATQRRFYMKLKSMAIFALTAILSLVGIGAKAEDTPSPTPTATAVLPATPITTTATQTPAEGYHGIGWGTALDEFKAAQKIVPPKSFEKAEAKAVDYLMFNFHEVQKRPRKGKGKFSLQQVEGDNTAYVFYDGQYRLAAVPIDLANLKDVRKEIEKKYAKKKLLSRTVQWEPSDYYGWTDMDFEFQEYEKSPETRLYLVTASFFLEDQGQAAQMSYEDLVQHGPGPSTLSGAYLIYLSEDYFKSGDNAWADYQASTTQTPTPSPEPEKVAAPTPTPTVAYEEKSKLQDLKNVE